MPMYGNHCQIVILPHLELFSTLLELNSVVRWESHLIRRSRDLGGYRCLIVLVSILGRVVMVPDRMIVRKCWYLQ